MHIVPPEHSARSARAHSGTVPIARVPVPTAFKRMLRTGCVVVTLLLSSAANAQPTPDPTQVRINKWLTPGRDAHDRGDDARAVSLTSAALAQASKQLPPSHWGLAYLLNDLARWKAAAGDRRGAQSDAE